MIIYETTVSKLWNDSISKLWNDSISKLWYVEFDNDFEIYLEFTRCYIRVHARNTTKNIPHRVPCNFTRQGTIIACTQCFNNFNIRQIFPESSIHKDCRGVKHRFRWLGTADSRNYASDDDSVTVIVKFVFLIIISRRQRPTFLLAPNNLNYQTQKVQKKLPNVEFLIQEFYEKKTSCMVQMQGNILLL